MKIKDLQEKANVEAFYLVRDKAILTGKTGKTYMNVSLVDNSGAIDGRVWDNVESLSKIFEPGDVIWIKGTVQLFQNRKQMVLYKIEKHAQDQFDMSEFIAHSSRDTQEMYNELLRLVGTCENLSIKKLLQSILEDPQITPRLLKSPAAKTIHHARMGGLLEHVLSMWSILEFLNKHYSGLNRDLLLAGTILHDIGKVWEIEISDGFQYSNRGRLIGHIEICCELIDEKAHLLPDFSPELKDLLKHMVLSHHGKLEFGSPKRPKFLEAFLLSMVDELDSKMDTISTFINDERNSSSDWSRFNSMFDRYFYLRDLSKNV